MGFKARPKSPKQPQPHQVNLVATLDPAPNDQIVWFWFGCMPVQDESGAWVVDDDDADDYPDVNGFGMSVSMYEHLNLKMPTKDQPVWLAFDVRQL